MKEEKKPLSVSRQLLANYKKHFANKTAYVSLFALVVFLCLTLAYFLPFTLFLTVPFIILPTFTGFICENFTVNMGGNNPAYMVFYGFRSYYNPAFLGVFRVIEGLLKSLIVYLASSTILTLILHLSIGAADPTYMQIFNNMTLSQNNEELLKYFEDLQGNQTFINIENITVLSSFGLASYMFIHHVITHSFKMYFNLMNKKPQKMNVINLIHRRVFRQFRKDFYQDYYSTCYLGIILFILGYVGGCFLGLFVLHQNGMQCVIIALALTFFVSMFFLPFLYDTYQLMFSIDNFYYLKGLIALSNEPIASSMYDVKLSPTEKENMEVMINAIGAILKEAENEKEKKKHKNKEQ